MSAIFLTGFPGFLGSALVERLLERYRQEIAIACLIQPKFRDLAKQRVAAIAQKQPAWLGRIHLYEGDITLPDLGLTEQIRSLQQETLEVYHLAAAYDLAIARELGMRVNVDGTHHLLRFAENCPNLRRFQYVSTCYVSGRYDGTFAENDLEKGQAFNNYYEETKYLAEVAVQQQSRGGLPATIYRPAIVLGDSHTGETQKYDGLYYIMQWLLRQPPIAFMPLAGNTQNYYANVVPRNFVIDAIAYLSSIEASKGKVYQLCDPNPPTVDDLLALLEQATQRKILRLRLPKRAIEGALKYVPGVYQLVRIKPEAIDYFVHPTRYDCSQTLADLNGTAIACPPISSYIERLVAFMRQHPEITSAAMG